MKAMVWTSWNTRMTNHDDGKPKCIFNGDIKEAPRIGEHIVVKDGYCAETVTDVIHDFVNGDVEITVDTSDYNNEYGVCLYRGSKDAFGTRL